jgi:Fe-S oxidoreductase
MRRAKVPAAARQSGGEKVIFLSDTFARYVEPQVEQAALDVLSACGYSVHLLVTGGAGAALLSKGFVEGAKRQARRVLDALERVDPSGEAVVVGIEPPEIYCLKNDYFDLLPERRSEIASRSARTWLLEEFLLRSEAFHSLRVANMSAANTSRQINPQKVLFQPHCHQRAEGPAEDGLPSGANATVALLRMCGYDVEVLESGCCGMAGTFGYEAEHYDLSMRVGELRVFPLLRSAPAEVLVSANGAACRMQIQQAAARDTLHPIQLIARLM